MRNTQIGLILLASVLVSLAPRITAAQNLLGFYAGAGLGESDVRVDAAPPPFGDHHTGWKLMAGVRPISFLGAELEYADFGDPHGTRATAGSLFGVGYLPLPLPWIDVYGKGGMARLEERISGVSYLPGAGPCPLNNPNCAFVPFEQSSTTTRFAYAVGAQARLGFIPGLSHLTVRAEYERISAPGDPDLLSVGLLWSF